jgi:LuxR family transcriptional regulator, maltose regulon positive regulatory protein
VAWLESGHLVQAAQAASTAEEQARRLGFGQHFYAVDYLRALAGLALERRDLDAAEQLTEQALSISERRQPACAFLTLLDRAAIWAARGQVRDALATIEAARPVLAGPRSVLLTRADEQEAVLRLSLGDLRTPAELAAGLPAARRALLLAKVALNVGDHQTAQEHLRALPEDLTPRHALVRQLLLAAAAISRDDPMTADLVTDALVTARSEGYCHTVVTTAAQLTSYLIEHSQSVRRDPFTDQLITAALQVRAAQPGVGSSRLIAGPLSAAELRVLKLLPISTYTQIADALYISRATVKTHLRSVYHKLGVTSRSLAIERAVDLRLL